MSKEMWIEAHERAIEEAMDKNPELSWDVAYKLGTTAERANVICANRYADMIDQARDRAKYK